MNLHLSTRVDGHAAVVTAAGEVDLETGFRLRETLLEATSASAPHIVVDLSEVTFLDSTGLGILIGTLKRVRVYRGSMALVGPQTNVRKVFEVTKLTDVFPIFDTVEDAVSSHPL